MWPGSKKVRIKISVELHPAKVEEGSALSSFLVSRDLLVFWLDAVVYGATTLPSVFLTHCPSCMVGCLFKFHISVRTPVLHMIRTHLNGFISWYLPL